VDNDILFVQILNRKIVIHTLEEPHVGSLTQQVEYILSQFGFERADANKFVQVSKILTRDKKERKVYFSADRTKYCTISRQNIKKFFW